MDDKEFEKQYKDHLSGFHQWGQKSHADQWMLFPQNIGANLSIDEVAVSNGELYTVLTNKEKHGGKGSLIAIVQGTKANDIAYILNKIPIEQREMVKEATMDFCPSMEIAVRAVFPNASVVMDRFHVQQLVTEAVQTMRIEERWKAIKQENKQVKKDRKQNKLYCPKTYANGDAKKQLLARSRYLLFKPSSKWTDSQTERAAILFNEFPKLRHAYHLSMMFRSIYEHSQTRGGAKQRLNDWYAKIEEKGYDHFITAAEYIKLHEITILNYFPNRSTNAGAESFNAKLKGFRALVRGVRDRKFFLFRVAKLYC
ncbi:MAG: transposase [Candidatus Magasanikbacteria bacterium]|nr:transposase [Candidatus Magasanikbacteria bacterium]